MNVILCGFMGCGKSSLGNVLSKVIRYNFIDMDSYIERNQGMTIPQIFREYSESGFREIEYRACSELSKLNNTVIATGGGTVMSQRNVEALKLTGKIVFLRVLEPVLLERIRNDPERPLAYEKSDEEIIALYRSRLPTYRRVADITFRGGVGVISDAEKLADLLLAVGIIQR